MALLYYGSILAACAAASLALGLVTPSDLAHALPLGLALVAVLLVGVL